MPFKCDQCDREFNTEQGLEQHKSDKHGVSRHEKKEVKKQREEERKEEIGKKISSKKKKRLAIIAIIIMAVIGVGYYVATSIPASTSGVVVGPAGSTHIHHDFKLYVNGQAIDFSQPKYQLRSRLVHFEGGDGFVIHTHATGMTLGYMLNTLGIQLAPGCIKVDSTNYCDDGSKTLKVYVNGEQTGNGDYLMKDLDKILVSYGSENVAEQLESITNLAITQSGRNMRV